MLLRSLSGTEGNVIEAEEMTVVVEITGLAGPSIRLSLPDPRGGNNGNGGVSIDAYPVLQQSLREMEQHFVDSSSMASPKIGACFKIEIIENLVDCVTILDCNYR